LCVIAVAVCLLGAGCGERCAVGYGVERDPLAIRLTAAAGNGPASIAVTGLSDDEVRRLSSGLTREQLAEVLHVSVGDGQPAVLGEYALDGRTLRFTPMFAFDPGRQYRVAFRSPTRAPGAPPVIETVGLPAVHTDPSTVVAHVFPSGDVVPENQLRLYIHFSAPMGRKGGLDYISLHDESGGVVVDPFLPLDAEFWNDDRTRYTVFFDPGRQKRGILPNQQMGRSLEPGKRYTLVVDRSWRDANGLPLKEDFRREFRVGTADEQPVDYHAWRVTPPRAGTRDAVAVTFPEPLDHGLLLRALGVTGGEDLFLAGEVKVEAEETRWSFTPAAAWREGAHQLVALSTLEDLAGNRIGRAFEVDRFDRVDRAEERDRTVIPFYVARGEP
jgi:hypothetical protein